MTASASRPSLPLARGNPLEPAGELARLRAEEPVARVISSTGEPAWLVTRYDDARAVLGDARFRLALPGAKSENGGAGSSDSLFQDPPGHTRLRRLVATAFTPRRAAGLRERTEEVAAGLVAEMAAKRQPVDVTEALCLPLPITVIGELLGVPADERDSFRAWSGALLSLPVPGAAAGRLAHPVAGLAGQVGRLIARKREHPGGDLLSALVAVRDSGADRLSEAELTMMAITLITAGYVTTSAAAGVGIVLLSRQDGLRRLAEHPALVPSAVEEVLRFQAAGGDLARRAREDVDVGGVRIRAGEKVVVSVAAANRDPRRFADPGHFDVARSDNAHLTFGHGIHHCLGAALARMELQVIFTTLAARLPGLCLAIPEDGLVWRRSELFGDEWLQAVPVTW